MDRKKIIIGAGVALAAYYVLSKSKQSAPAPLSAAEQDAAAKRQSAAVYSANIGDGVQATRMSEEDEEYNLLRQDAIAMGINVKSSWTLAMIRNAMEEQEKRNDALQRYIDLTGDRTTDLSDASVADIYNLISAEQQARDKAERDAKASKKANWDARCKQLDTYVANLVRAFNTPYTQWDKSLWNGAVSVEKAEEKTYFKQKFEAQNVRTYYQYLAFGTKTVKGIVACCDAYINHVQKNTSTGRTQREIIATVRSKFDGVPDTRLLDEYGEFIG